LTGKGWTLIGTPAARRLNKPPRALLVGYKCVRNEATVSGCERLREVKQQKTVRGRNRKGGAHVQRKIALRKKKLKKPTIGVGADTAFTSKGTKK